MRRALQDLDGQLPEEPEARMLFVWVSYEIWKGGEQMKLWTVKCLGRQVGHSRKGNAVEGDCNGTLLAPIFVEHDRSRHAERLALLELLAFAAGADMPEDQASGRGSS